MNIGDKILHKNNATIDKITNIVPVLHRDDGNDEWYEVCEPYKTGIVAILGKDNNNKDVMVIIKRNEDNMNLMLDVLL